MLVAENLNRSLPQDDVDGLLNYLSSVSAESFRDEKINDYLQKKAFLQIHDEKGKLLYGKDEEKISFSEEELNYIPQFQGDVLYSAVPFKTDTGEKRYLLSASHQTDSNSSDNGYMILDEHLNILESSKATEKKSFTQQEFNALTGNYLEEGSFYRKDYTNAQGEKRTAVFSLSPFNYADYSLAMTLWEYSWVIMGALYLVLVGASIFWLDRKTKSFLRPLDESITSLLSDSPTQLIHYEGPKEFVDIYTRFNDLARRLEQSENEREKLDSARNKMLTDISHDLRTPITVIQGYAKALHDGLVPDEKKIMYTDTIYQKSVQLTRLIDAFFEYSKLSHPQLPLDMREVDLSEFAKSYLAENYKELDLAGFHLEVDIPEKVIPAVIDPLQIRRALDNLLSNAIKYNPAGTTLYFSILEQKETLRIFIGSDGEGIPDFLKESIFEPFVVGDEARGNNSTGLGLAISAKILALHRGNLRLLPSEAPYTVLFELTLPKNKEIA